MQLGQADRQKLLSRLQGQAHHALHRPPPQVPKISALEGFGDIDLWIHED